MAATEDIVSAFGGMDAMSEGLLKQDLSAVGKMLSILVNAGYEYCELMGEEHPPRPKGRLTALLSVQETEAIVQQIIGIITGGTARTVEVHSKNA